MTRAEWSLRTTAPDLRARYLADGWWTDDTLSSLIAAKVAERPDLGFRIWSDAHPATTTVADIWERSRRFAAGLLARGVEPGDVVAFQFPNCAEAAVAFWGATAAGAVVVPVVHFYGPKELEYILRESRARVLVTADRFGRLDYLDGIASLRPRLDDLETVVAWRSGAGDEPLPSDVVGFADVGSHDPLTAPIALEPGTPAVVGYTSGTRADPKGVIHTHRSLIAEIRQLAAMQSPDDLPMMIGAPVAHAIGMLGGLLVPLQRGRDIHITDAWNPAVVLAAMLEAGISAGSGATVFLTSLLDHPDFTPAHAALMRGVGLGGAPVPTAVVERAEGLGISVTRSYGSTEHPSTTGSDPTAPVERRMDGVAEVAVVAAPDERLGEHGCAYVRLRPDGTAPDLARVQDHLEAAGLARPKWPEELHVVEEFPRTPSGKIKKFVLRRQRRDAEHA